MMKEYPDLKKVTDDYYSEMAELREKYEKKKNSVYPEEETKQKKLNAIKTEARAIQDTYKKKLDKEYEKKQQEIKERVGFGDDDPAKTRAELSFAEDLDREELKTLIDRYQESNNYIGLKKIKPIATDKSIGMDFTGISDELESLEKYYKGKQKRFSDDPINDSEENRLKKLFRV